jgi:hypothetical protein
MTWRCIASRAARRRRGGPPRRSRHVRRTHGPARRARFAATGRGTSCRPRCGPQRAQRGFEILVVRRRGDRQVKAEIGVLAVAAPLGRVAQSCRNLAISASCARCGGWRPWRRRRVRWSGGTRSSVAGRRWSPAAETPARAVRPGRRHSCPSPAGIRSALRRAAVSARRGSPGARPRTAGPGRSRRAGGRLRNSRPRRWRGGCGHAPHRPEAWHAAPLTRAGRGRPLGGWAGSCRVPWRLGGAPQAQQAVGRAEAARFRHQNRGVGPVGGTAGGQARLGLAQDMQHRDIGGP